MTPEELTAECRRKISVWEENRSEYPNLRPFINLVLRKRERAGERMRLCGRRGPLGEVISWIKDDEFLVQFDPRKVLAWLEKPTKAAEGEG